MLVEIVTPEASLWAGEASAVVARSSEGEFTIMDQHAPTVGDLVPGVVRVVSAEGDVAYLVHGGFFQVGPNFDGEGTRTTLLAGVAERVSDINVARATMARENAQTVIDSSPNDDTLANDALSSLARAELRLRFS